METWLAIVFAGLATYATRSLPLLVRVPIPERGPVRRYLDALPTSIIAALAGAAIIAPDQRAAIGPEIPASLVVIGLVAWRRNLLLGVLAGVATIALIRAV
jgi:branched-subunit amino acid transport protein